MRAVSKILFLMYDQLRANYLGDGDGVLKLFKLLGSYPQIEKITQTGSSFVAIRMIDDPWNQKGSQSLQGELDKSGIKRVTILWIIGMVLFSSDFKKHQ